RDRRRGRAADGSRRGGMAPATSREMAFEVQPVTSRKAEINGRRRGGLAYMFSRTLGGSGARKNGIASWLRIVALRVRAATSGRMPQATTGRAANGDAANGASPHTVNQISRLPG